MNIDLRRFERSFDSSMIVLICRIYDAVHPRPLLLAHVRWHPPMDIIEIEKQKRSFEPLDLLLISISELFLVHFARKNSSYNKNRINLIIIMFYFGALSDRDPAANEADDCSYLWKVGRSNQWIINTWQMGLILMFTWGLDQKIWITRLVWSWWHWPMHYLGIVDQ